MGRIQARASAYSMHPAYSGMPTEVVGIALCGPPATGQPIGGGGFTGVARAARGTLRCMVHALGALNGAIGDGMAGHQ
jgi:hypothetical protein